MPDEILISNDSYGYTPADTRGNFATTLVTSTLAASASGVLGFAVNAPAYFNGSQAFGRIIDFGIAVVKPALSASGFVSGTVDAGVYINGAAVMSTRPAIPMVALSASTTTPRATNAGGGTSGVVNGASAAVSAGNIISFDYNGNSAGSAAAGVAGTGLTGWVTIRWGAR